MPNVTDHEARGIREGTVTQIRRVVKPQPDLPKGFILEVPGPQSGRAIPVCWDCKLHGVKNDSPHSQLWLTEMAIESPLGKVGDVVGCKEKWCKPFTESRAGATGSDAGFIYLVDGPDFLPVIERAHNWPKSMKGVWKSAASMPQKAIRTFIRLKSIRVERVQSMAEADALACGYKPLLDDSWREPGKKVTQVTAPENYAHAFDATNGKGSWASNPWVWVYSFAREGEK